MQNEINQKKKSKRKKKKHKGKKKNPKVKKKKPKGKKKKLKEKMSSFTLTKEELKEVKLYKDMVVQTLKNFTLETNDHEEKKATEKVLEKLDTRWYL